MTGVHPFRRASSPGLPVKAGLGLKPQHFRDVLADRPEVGFFEVHAENYLVDGGPFHHFLTEIADRYPLSMHGVGLSIGSEEPLDGEHLARIGSLVDRYAPASFSEHLAWSSHGGAFLNDLLPVPYTDDTLDRVCTHVNRVQEHLRRRILIENPATYVEFDASTMSEAQFLGDLIRRTGCGLLLDVNNAYVSCVNHGREPRRYIDSLPLSEVGEIHLAGFAVDRDGAGAPLLIDTHGTPVDTAVWDLYVHALAQVGPVATLIERDNDVPPLPMLVDEARKADELLADAGVVHRSRCA